MGRIYMRESSANLATELTLRYISKFILVNFNIFHYNFENETRVFGKVTIHGFGTPALPDSETPGLPGSLRGSEAI